MPSASQIRYSTYMLRFQRGCWRKLCTQQTTSLLKGTTNFQFLYAWLAWGACSRWNCLQHCALFFHFRNGTRCSLFASIWLHNVPKFLNSSSPTTFASAKFKADWSSLCAMYSLPFGFEPLMWAPSGSKHCLNCAHFLHRENTCLHKEDFGRNKMLPLWYCWSVHSEGDRENHLYMSGWVHSRCGAWMKYKLISKTSCLERTNFGKVWRNLIEASAYMTKEQSTLLIKSSKIQGLNPWLKRSNCKDHSGMVVGAARTCAHFCRYCTVSKYKPRSYTKIFQDGMYLKAVKIIPCASSEWDSSTPVTTHPAWVSAITSPLEIICKQNKTKTRAYSATHLLLGTGHLDRRWECDSWSFMRLFFSFACDGWARFFGLRVLERLDWTSELAVDASPTLAYYLSKCRGGVQPVSTSSRACDFNY